MYKYSIVALYQGNTWGGELLELRLVFLIPPDYCLVWNLLFWYGGLLQ